MCYWKEWYEAKNQSSVLNVLQSDFNAFCNKQEDLYDSNLRPRKVFVELNISK